MVIFTYLSCFYQKYSLCNPLLIHVHYQLFEECFFFFTLHILLVALRKNFIFKNIYCREHVCASIFFFTFNIKYKPSHEHTISINLSMIITYPYKLFKKIISLLSPIFGSFSYWLAYEIINKGKIMESSGILWTRLTA